MSFKIQPFTKEHKAWATALLIEHWGSARSVSRGRIYQANDLPGFVAVEDGKPVGLATYKVTGNKCEITTMNSLAEGKGVGSALVEAVKKAAFEEGCQQLWLVTTNDNTRALRFWQRRGFTIAAVHVNALEQSRKLKPEIPVIGNDGIPIRDEIELERKIYEGVREEIRSTKLEARNMHEEGNNKF
jgi:ribosomal protein S18 acetylase RimI-like enzyme